MVNLQGTTSDSIWPQLDAAIRASFPKLKERTETRAERVRHSLSDAVVSEERKEDSRI